MDRTVPHSVFWDEPVITTNNLWEHGELVNVVEQGNSRVFYFYGRNAGFGGSPSNININQMDYIKIIVRNGTEVVSSYPVPLPY